MVQGDPYRIPYNLKALPSYVRRFPGFYNVIIMPAQNRLVQPLALLRSQSL